MSQILEALKKADEERKENDNAGLRDVDTLALMVATEKRHSPLLLLAMLGISVVGIASVSVYLLINHGENQKMPITSKQPIVAEKFVTVKDDTASNSVSSVVRGNVKNDLREKRKGSEQVNLPKQVRASSSLNLPSAPIAKVEVTPVPKKVTASKATTKSETKTKTTTDTVSKQKPIKAPVTASKVSTPSIATSSVEKSSKSNTASQFKINVLYFSESPSERFVIINGARLKEGQTIPSSSYHILSIRVDGVIIDSKQGSIFIKSI